MLSLAGYGVGMGNYERHIIHTLRREAGYHSALAGIEHIGDSSITSGNAKVIGYDQFLGPEGEELLEGAEAFAAQEAANFLSSDPPQPFFLEVGFFETHRFDELDPSLESSFNPTGRQGDSRYCIPPPTLPDVPEVRKDIADFEMSVERLDQKVGIVLDALDKNGLRDNTLVIFTTDHGLPFPGMKSSCTDHGIGVSLVMHGPGGFTGGRVCDALVSQIDIFPTLCELLEIRLPEWIQGVSLLPLIRGEVNEVRENIFAEVTYHIHYEPQRAVRTHRWKYIRKFDDSTTPILDHCDPSLSKELWVEHDWIHRPADIEQLYDLMFDPNEAHNLAGDPLYAEVLDDMRQRLENWMNNTDDPLLHGKVPLPSGAFYRRLVERPGKHLRRLGR
jgi:arylsulfatase A-like enzyme